MARWVGRRVGPARSDASIGDDGATLTRDMVGEGMDDFGTLTYEEVFCVLEELEAPDSVTAPMGETTAMDGRQSGDWDDITASWSYHPDDGLDMILTVE